ncbi:MAG: hypothetical protein JWQ20_2704 [Conexibacter sp.]|nr:hypothetical protein [Conexibacter sp.]
MTQRRRTALFAAVTVAAVAAIAVYVGIAAFGGSGAADQPSASASGGTLRIARGDLLMLDRDRKRPNAWGRVVVIAPDGRRRLSRLTCERVAFAGGSGICLAQSRTFPAPAFEARLFDAGQKVTAKMSLQGSPSRARVSPDGAYAASTSFVGGDSYVTPGAFSTRTRIYDVRARRSLGDLEDFAVLRGGRRFDRPDLNFWGVTFTGQGAGFYATLATGDHHYLVRGDATTRQVRIVRDGVECPSLSPDGTRIGFKARVGKPFRWRFHVLDLKSGRETALPGSESVDDQIAWLDDRRLAYGVGEEVMTLPADGSLPPRRLMASATNPTRVQ